MYSDVFLFNSEGLDEGHEGGSSVSPPAQPDPSGVQSLVEAIRKGDFREVDVELAKEVTDNDGKALANATVDGRPILHLAIESMNIAVIKAFIGAGADVNAVDADGNSPLLLAAKKDIQSLAGGEVSAGERKKSEAVRVPIMIELVAAGAKIDKAGKDGEFPLNYIKDERFKQSLITRVAERAEKPYDEVAKAAGVEVAKTVEAVEAAEVAEADTHSATDSNSLAEQITRFIKTGVVLTGKGLIYGKDDFIAQMGESILTSGQAEQPSDSDRAAARKTAEFIYDELERMSQRSSVDNGAFRQSVNDLARAALDFFTDLIFGEDKAATRSTIQDVLRANTQAGKALQLTPQTSTQQHGAREGALSTIEGVTVRLHDQLKTTMDSIKAREKSRHATTTTLATQEDSPKLGTEMDTSGPTLLASVTSNESSQTIDSGNQR